MIDEKGFIVKNKFSNLSRSILDMPVRKVDFMNDEELMALPVGSVMVFDVECYRNFFYVCFKSLENNKYADFELSYDRALEIDKLSWMMWRFCLVGFNSQTYDVPMCVLAMNGLDNDALKQASDFIIQSGPAYGNKKTTPWDIEKAYKVRIPTYNHIDLFNVCPVNGGVSERPASLKLYSGRIHAPRMQDLPIEPGAALTQADAAVVRPYCANDLDDTHLLFNELAPEIKLRMDMSEEYGLDLRSKSDAQIAEAVINKELEKITGIYPRRPNTVYDKPLKYNLPDFIQFQTPELNKVLNQLLDAEFELDKLGSPIWPQGLGEHVGIKKGKPCYELKVKIGKMVYKLGMGGVHSTEKNIAHVAQDDEIIADNDVASYYPNIVINQNLYPPQLGEAFVSVYNSILTRRLDAKKRVSLLKKERKKLLKMMEKFNGKALEIEKRLREIETELVSSKTETDSLKVTSNGSFGKLGNKYSSLYAPQLLLQVTITGQLLLLMLIEALEGIGIEVISANTDGFISKYKKSRHQEVRDLIAAWEAHTNFKTEETQYSAVYSRDVNNYIAIKVDGEDEQARFFDERWGAKTKGDFCERGSALNSILSKNPESMICNDAVIALIKNNTPIEKTIRECKDIRRFVTVRNVHGGAVKTIKGKDVYLGKTVRWYYSESGGDPIYYVLSGNRVPVSEGAQPCMDLPSEFPTDIDYQRYEQEATDKLYDLGYLKRPKTLYLFNDIELCYH